MIAVRRVEERQRERTPWRLAAPELAGEEAALRLLDLWLAPGERIELGGRRAYELITYVSTGALAHHVGDQTTALIGPGEFQRAAIGGEHAAAQAQSNPSRSEASHVVQLLLHDPRTRLSNRRELRRFSFAERRGFLCAVASSAGAGLLAVQSEITLYSAVVEPGQHLVHGFAAARSGVLHVVSGELSVAGYVLGQGDVMHAVGERSLAFTAREQAEVLLGDVRAISF